VTFVNRRKILERVSNPLPLQDSMVPVLRGAVIPIGWVDGDRWAKLREIESMQGVDYVDQQREHWLLSQLELGSAIVKTAKAFEMEPFDGSAKPLVLSSG